MFPEGGMGSHHRIPEHGDLGKPRHKLFQELQTPRANRIGAGDIVHRGAAGVVLDVAHPLVEIVGREINAGPARHQGQRAFGADVPDIVGVFSGGLRPVSRRVHGSPPRAAR
jgi:hypothetical protein